MALNDDEEKALKENHDKAAKAKDDEIAKLKADLEKYNKPNPPPDDKEKDLREKAAKEKADAEARKGETKNLENALKFNLSVGDFAKTNKDLLPNEVEDILKQAEKENYDSAVEKARALKSSILMSFFNVQANVDLLTSSQKTQIDDFKKLTKNGREEKSEAIFENIFEPALEMMKRVKKAEELGKSSSGHSSGSKTENAYKEKLMNVSRKTHLGEGK